MTFTHGNVRGAQMARSEGAQERMKALQGTTVRGMRRARSVRESREFKR